MYKCLYCKTDLIIGKNWSDSCAKWKIKFCKICYREKCKKYTYRWRKSNPIRFRNNEKKSRQKLSRKIIEIYGGKCACCGETRFEFLSIDHINNDGATHRKQIRIGFYSWLRKNHYPQDGRFQVLCMNCNFAKGKYGHCPHTPLKELSTLAIIS